MWCSVRTDAELDELDEHTIPRLDHFRFDWEIPGRSSNWRVRQSIKNLFPRSIQWLVDVFFAVVIDGRSAYKLDVNRLIEVTIENCGHLTFQEAFDRTGRIINITVAPVNDFDPPRLLNYLTAPHVCVWSAAVASCAIPGVFEPVPLIVREPDGKYTEEHVWGRHGGEAEQKTLGRYSDGSVENDLPMEQLAELFNVNHFIVSQVSFLFLLVFFFEVISTIYLSTGQSSFSILVSNVHQVNHLDTVSLFIHQRTCQLFKN